MKKLFLMLAVCGLALNTACDKNDDPKTDPVNPNPTPEEPAGPKARLVSFNSGGWDTYVYTYDGEGKVVKIDRNNGERTWDVTYSGNTITMSGYSEMTMTVGDNGYVSYLKDGYNDEFYYTYDANGYVASIKKFDELKGNTIIKDGNCTGWSRFKDGEEEFKIHTFLDTKNLAGIHTGYMEYGAGRWMVELGWFGKANANIVDTNQWASYEGDDTKKSFMSYEYDDNGFVTKETKTYGGKDEVYTFTWEVIE